MHDPDVDIIVVASQVRCLARLLGLGDGSYALVRAGTNIVFANHDNKVLARVAPPVLNAERVAATAAAAAALAAGGAPVVEPLTLRAVRTQQGMPVTFWPLGQTSAVSPGVLAELAAECHRCSPPARLSRWTPAWLAAWRRKLIAAAAGTDTPKPWLALLEHRLEQTHSGIRDRWDPTAPLVVIHGDLTPGNVVRFGDEFKLCDLDNVRLGPCEVDIAATAMHCRRIWGGDTWATFNAAYPRSYRRGLMEALATEKEIADCLWMAAMWEPRPDCRSMLAHRVESLDDPNVLWNDP